MDEAASAGLLTYRNAGVLERDLERHEDDVVRALSGPIICRSHRLSLF